MPVLKINITINITQLLDVNFHWSTIIVNVKQSCNLTNISKYVRPTRGLGLIINSKLRLAIGLLESETWNSLKQIGSQS